MKVSELGEFGLIDVLAGLVGAEEKTGEAWRNLIIGIGDDAAAWQGEAKPQLATIDALVQDIHFKLGMTSWEELGWKSLAINLSDIAAMGGSPRYALVSLALPEDTDVRDIVFFYQGMLSLARQFEMAVVGGNISRAPLVTINIAVFGSSEGAADQLLTRSGAQIGDKVAVTGYLGAAAAGLKMLTANLQFDAESNAALRRAFLQPSPRIAEGKTLVGSGVKAAIDISDGLVSDLGHICKASQLGACIQSASLPVAPAVKANFGAKALELALSGGEDYELLFTAPATVVDIVKSQMACPVTVIGEMVADRDARVTLLDENGREFELPKAGWDHFAQGKHGV